MKFLIVIVAMSIGLTGCADWIYRIDVPQGNFLDEKEVGQLRIGMTKEQVEFILGKPVVKDTFDHDTWYYLYEMKRGMAKRGEDFKRSLVISFVDDKISQVEGDFELSDDFLTPLD